MSDILKKTLVVGANIPPLLSLVSWPFMLLMSIFLFDAPGSTRSIPTLGLATTIWAYPLPVITGAILTYKAFRANDYGRCVQGTALSYSGALLVGIMYGVIVWVCGGQFVC